MSHHLAVTIGNTLSDLARIQGDVSAFVADQGVGPDSAYAVELAVEELISNVIRHGYDDQGHHEITLSLAWVDGAVHLVIEDDGRPFDPNGHPTPPAPRSLDVAPVGGRGIALVRQLAGPIDYERVGGRNRVRLRIGS